MEPIQKAARQLAGETGGEKNHRQDTSILLSEREAAKRLSLSPRKLFDLRQINAIPHCKVDRRVFYPSDGVRAWVDAGCPTTPSAAETLKWKGGAS